MVSPNEEHLPVLKGIVHVGWELARDTFGHNLSYSFQILIDVDWVTVVGSMFLDYYDWYTTQHEDGTYQIRIIAVL